MNKHRYLFILILFILASVVGDNRILQVFGNQPPTTALMLSMGLLILQMLAAPIQAGFSDFYCRKKSLIVALVFSFLSIILLFFTKSRDSLSMIFFILILLMNGALGNIVPLSWSALADTQEKNLRFFLALSTGAYAVGYMVLAVLNMYSINFIFGLSWLSLNDSIPSILFVLSIMLCVLFFRDLRDRKMHHAHQNEKYEFLWLAHSEFMSLVKEVRSPSTRWGLLSYFLWATSQYSVVILLTDFQTEYTFTVISMMFGYLTGIVILGFCTRIKDEVIIKTGFIITISALSLFFIINPFINKSDLLLSICYFFYTCGNAFLTPSILSLFSKERSVHQQGKGFGLIVSADSCGFLVATVAVIFYNYLSITTNHMIVFSFVTFLISWFPYIRYERLRKNVVRH